MLPLNGNPLSIVYTEVNHKDETAYFDGGWGDDVILHDGSLCENGYVEVPDKTGLGIELNPDIVKANLLPGEVWWE